MTTTPKQPMQKKIMTAIECGELTMRPKWQFVLKTLLVWFGSLTVVFAILYLTSFILFVLRRSGVSVAPHFGWHGWYAFLLAMPWLLILLLLIFVIILEILVRHYAFAYRRPLLFSALGILVIVVVGGQVVAMTPFHPRLSESADRGHLPVAGPWYRTFGHPHPRNIHKGTITTLTNDGFILYTRRPEILTIIITPRTRLPRGVEIRVTDTVVVFGDRTDHTVYALGVEKVRPERE